MAYYEWVCKDCKLIWEREYDMGKAPDRTRCPECSKLSERHFDGSINVSWGDDMDSWFEMIFIPDLLRKVGRPLLIVQKKTGPIW